MPSALLLSHWSNGAPGWSQGPPTEDAVMTISYVKAYFNSSEPARQRDQALRCVDQQANNAICEIPDQHGPPDTLSMGGNSTARGTANTFFFSAQLNTTNNQTVFTGLSAGHEQYDRGSLRLFSCLLLVLYMTFYF